MEWRKCYLDVVLVPLGLFITMGYHAWLWQKVRTQPLSTIIGMNVTGRRFWVSAMMKVQNDNHSKPPLHMSFLCDQNLVPDYFLHIIFDYILGFLLGQ